ncbi:MAG TPA: glycosyltransferase family 4 protein [Candidatus Saccharibacteria bacterium]|nr:glycosyltransferase family 4 protein [Candidatus Saccharibacteria bacterium]
MNILMLGWELPPHNSGGLGVACYHMSKALALKGASIDFVVPYKATHPEIDFMRIHSATPLSPLHRYGMGAYDSKFFEESLLGGEEIGDVRDIRGVQRKYVRFVDQLLDTVQPDAIHAHDWLTIEAGMHAKQKSGAPLIVHVHATEFDRSGEDYGNPVVHEIEYQGLMMADRIIAVSNITKSLIVQRYGIPADKVEVIHNALDVDSFANYSYDDSTYRYLETLKQEGYTIVATVTRFTIQKGLTHFLKAAARASEKYDKFVFLLAGDGEQRDELLRMSADLGIADKVVFTGFVRGKQWRDAYSVADVFVMSSVSEPFGLTALEAAHHDNAVIVTRQSGVGEVLHSIFRYDFWDTDVLADQLVGIAASRSLKYELTQSVKHEYARISWASVADRCLQLYQHVKEKAYA